MYFTGEVLVIVYLNLDTQNKKQNIINLANVSSIEHCIYWFLSLLTNHPFNRRYCTQFQNVKEN